MLLPLKYNLRSLLRCKERTILTILGISLVVMIFITMTAMGRGMLSSIQSSGSSDNIIILGKGAVNTVFSSIKKDIFHVIKYAPYVKNNNGEPLVAPEVQVASLINGKFTMVNGVTPTTFYVHDKIRLLKGNHPHRNGGVIIGKMLNEKLGMRLDIGDEIEMEGRKWKIVGLFEAPGTFWEASVLTDINDLLSVTARKDYSLITIKAEKTSQIGNIINFINSLGDISPFVDAEPEQKYYYRFGNMFKSAARMGLIAAIIVSIAAIFGGMNTMYTAISKRVREIATLRAIGFSEKNIMLSFILESLIMSLIGGVVGCILGYSSRFLTMSLFLTTFKFKVTSNILLAGMLLSFFIGIIGGLLPARQASKLKIVEGIRHI